MGTIARKYALGNLANLRGILPGPLHKYVSVILEEYEHSPGQVAKWIPFATLSAEDIVVKKIVDMLMHLEGVRATINGKVYYP